MEIHSVLVDLEKLTLLNFHIIEAIYRFSVIPIKISKSFFTEKELSLINLYGT